MKHLIFLVPLVIVIAAILYMTKNTDDATPKALSNTVVSEHAPRHLVSAFPKTDWSKVNPKISNAISGGPPRDGIPALENPTFIPLKEFSGSDDMQAVLLQSDQEIKVYPYSILTWHEIVNDTFNGNPVAVNFCPLCGSAIVYDRKLPDGRLTTFGVSGSLLESNMIMYDRTTESFWQQSTGEALAGEFLGEKLELVNFQLLSLGQIRENYPDAIIMSKDTGYQRDYERNPYAGYDTNDSFVFEPSNIDDRFEPKTIMVVFYADGSPVVTPWIQLRAIERLNAEINGVSYTLTVSNAGELTVTGAGDKALPFYFEMWFSAAAQHGDKLQVIE